MARQFLAAILKTEGIALSSANINGIRHEINIEKRDSGTIRISVLASKPTEAYNLVRTVFKQYKRVIEAETADIDSSHRLFIEEQLVQSKTHLDQIEQKLLKFQEQEETCLLPEQADEEIKQFAEYERQKAEVKISLTEAELRFAEAEKMLNNEEPKVKSTITEIINPILRQYKTQLMDLETALVKARQNYTDQSPNVQSLLAQQDDLLKKMMLEKEILRSDEVATQYLKGMIEIIGLQARQKSIDTLQNAQKAILDGLPEKLLIYGQLTREQKAAEQVYLLLLNQSEQVMISEHQPEKIRIQIIDTPIIPDRKYSPSTIRYAFFAGITAFFSGVVFILLKKGIMRVMTQEINQANERR
jgi:uncharacterized protein involved in exopolysaccharide biosynthesis